MKHLIIMIALGLLGVTLLYFGTTSIPATVELAAKTPDRTVDRDSSGESINEGIQSNTPNQNAGQGSHPTALAPQKDSVLVDFLNPFDRALRVLEGTDEMNQNKPYLTSNSNRPLRTTEIDEVIGKLNRIHEVTSDNYPIHSNEGNKLLESKKHLNFTDHE